MDEERNEEQEIKQTEELTGNVIEGNNTTNTESTTSTTSSTSTDGKGFSIAALVLGIISLVICCLWYVSIPCAILAIIFGILGIRKKAGKGMAIGGLVTGVIAICLWVLLFIFAFSVGFTGGLFEALQEELGNTTSYNSYYDSYYDYY